MTGGRAGFAIHVAYRAPGVRLPEIRCAAVNRRMGDDRHATRKVFPGKRWSQRMRQREVPASRRRIHDDERAGRRRHGFAFEIADDPARHLRPDAPESNFLAELEPIHHQDRSGEARRPVLSSPSGAGRARRRRVQRQATTPILPTPDTYGEATHSPRRGSAPSPARSTRQGNTRPAGSSSLRARARPTGPPIAPTIAAPAPTRAAALKPESFKPASPNTIRRRWIDTFCRNRSKRSALSLPSRATSPKSA